MSFKRMTTSNSSLTENFVDSQSGLARVIEAANMGMAACVVHLTDSIRLSEKLPEISTDIDINGNGFYIDGDEKHQIFTILDGHLQIQNLTMKGGRALPSDWWGGAILVGESCSLFVNNCVFMGNGSEIELGGAIFNNGDAVIRESTFKNNEAHIGGAIVNNSDSMGISDCIFSANSSNWGGGVTNTGSLYITRSTFAENTAQLEGGAISIQAGTTHISNSTFGKNHSDDVGGAISHGIEGAGDYDCITTLTHVTIAYNSAKRNGGGVFIREDKRRGEFGRKLKTQDKVNAKHKLHFGLSARNCIIASNFKGDLTGDLYQNVNNLIEDGSCNPSLDGNPMLGKLTGSPAVFPLRFGSPAINNANSSYCLPTDQAGTKRPQGESGDIGSFELPQDNNRKSTRLGSLLG